MIRVFVILIAIFSTNLFSDEVYFMPQDAQEALDDMTKSISKAKFSIKAAIYSFTHKDIAKALKKAAQNGADVEIIYDYESNIDTNHSTLKNLALYKKIKVRTLKGAQKKNYFGKMHAKFIIIDNKKLFFGSANWSKSAFGVNYEVLYKTDDFKIIEKFNTGYNSMLKNSKIYK